MANENISGIVHSHNRPFEKENLFLEELDMNSEDDYGKVMTEKSEASPRINERIEIKKIVKIQDNFTKEFLNAAKNGDLATVNNLLQQNKDLYTVKLLSGSQDFITVR